MRGFCTFYYARGVCVVACVCVVVACACVCVVCVRWNSIFTPIFLLSFVIVIITWMSRVRACVRACLCVQAPIFLFLMILLCLIFDGFVGAHERSLVWV